MKSNRQCIARIGLALSFLLSIAGCFALCDCPGFYILAALFALVTILCGTRGLKLWGAVALGVALVILPSQINSEGSARERARKGRSLQRERQQVVERDATNS